MLKLIRGIAIAGALALGGCAGGSSLPNISGGGVDPATIAQIQNTVAQVCRFAPTAVSVANIAATFIGGGGFVDIVSSATDAICKVVNSKGAKRGAVMKVRGVTLKGKRLSR